MLKVRVDVAIGAALLIVFSVTGPSAFSASSTTDNLFCVNKSSKAVSKSTKGTCPKNSKRIYLGATGPRGPQGPVGPSGAPGPAGNFEVFDKNGVSLGKLLGANLDYQSHLLTLTVMSNGRVISYFSSGGIVGTQTGTDGYYLTYLDSNCTGPQIAASFFIEESKRTGIPILQSNYDLGFPNQVSAMGPVGSILQPTSVYVRHTVNEKATCEIVDPYAYGESFYELELLYTLETPPGPLTVK